MPGTQLEAQVEQLFLRFARFGLKLRDRQIPHRFPVALLHAVTASSVRATILVAIGSFAAANSSARRPVAASTPASSKRIRPGRTTATQASGLPLPEPIRTSAGFFVIGLSGKTLIQTFPPRLI